MIHLGRSIHQLHIENDGASALRAVHDSQSELLDKPSNFIRLYQGAIDLFMFAEPHLLHPCRP